MKFKKNDVVHLNDGDLVIKDLLGEGGQGTVYLAEFNGKQYALKVYIDTLSPNFKYNLKHNIALGSPSSDFLWPQRLIEFDDESTGYLMDLRPSNFSSFVKYLNGNVAFKDTYTLVTWCIELCKSFKQLHEKGFSYQDLNDGSFFLDPNTGDLLICDNDNVTADKRNLGVLGKMRYMAPEIVRGDKDPSTGARWMPDVHTDRFSLSIILFLALCLGNPFEGECLKKYDIIDEVAEAEMYGSNPVFIYHKIDESNRPIRGYHTTVIKRWPLIPLYVKLAFHRTFVEGLKDRENERTTEIEWIKVLTKYRDELMTCPSCGNMYIYGFGEKKDIEKCPYCHEAKPGITYLHINRNQIVLQPGKKIYANHIDKYSSDYNNVVGFVVRNKNNPSLWGIKMNIDRPILTKDSSGAEKEIQVGGVIPIVNGLKIMFDTNSIGEIKK